MDIAFAFVGGFVSGLCLLLGYLFDDNLPADTTRIRDCLRIARAAVSLHRRSRSAQQAMLDEVRRQWGLR